MGDESKPAPTDELAEEPTAEFVFQEVKSVIEYQHEVIGALDTKASFVLTSAAILIVAGAGIYQNLEPASNTALWGIDDLRQITATRILLALTGLACLASFLFAGRAYRVRDWKVSPEPRPFIEEAWSLPIGKVRSDYLAQLVFDFERTDIDIEKKRQRLDQAFTALEVETVLLVLLILAQV